ncbi:MAG: ATP-binding cassette domain-containing protein [Ferruginibacter sp.]
MYYHKSRLKHSALSVPLDSFNIAQSVCIFAFSVTFAAMHYASIENISKSFGIRTLFKNITLNVEEGDKIALVARNGSGKSTLLKIITGLDTPDEGTVWVHKDIKVVMLQQDNDFDGNKSIWDNVLRLDNPVVKVVKEYEVFLEDGQEDIDKLGELMGRLDDLNAWSFESDLKQILGKLNLHHLNEKVGNLSGGQKKRVALAQALIEADLHQGRCLLILDEPTNHLDVEMIEWLEDYLAAAKVTLLLVTHDRYFLDTVCNEIIEIDEEKVYVYKGDYDNFLEQKACGLRCSKASSRKTRIFSGKSLNGCGKTTQGTHHKKQEQAGCVYRSGRPCETKERCGRSKPAGKDDAPGR